MAPEHMDQSTNSLSRVQDQTSQKARNSLRKVHSALVKNGISTVIELNAQQPNHPWSNETAKLQKHLWTQHERPASASHVSKAWATYPIVARARVEVSLVHAATAQSLSAPVATRRIVDASRSKRQDSAEQEQLVERHPVISTLPQRMDAWRQTIRTWTTWQRRASEASRASRRKKRVGCTVPSAHSVTTGRNRLRFIRERLITILHKRRQSHIIHEALPFRPQVSIQWQSSLSRWIKAQVQLSHLSGVSLQTTLSLTLMVAGQISTLQTSTPLMAQLETKRVHLGSQYRRQEARNAKSLTRSAAHIKIIKRKRAGNGANWCLLAYPQTSIESWDRRLLQIVEVEAAHKLRISLVWEHRNQSFVEEHDLDHLLTCLIETRA